MNWRLAIAILEVLHACAMLADGGEFTPTLAAGGGYAAVATPDPIDPDIGNICPDCNGKGWVGDGTIRNKCTACDGTGKLTTMASVDAPRPEQQLPEVSDSLHGASTSAPEATGGQEAPTLPSLEELRGLAASELSNELVIGLYAAFEAEVQPYWNREHPTMRRAVEAWLRDKIGEEEPAPEPEFIVPTPAIQPTYDDACQEATRTRELLVVTYDTEEHRAAALGWLQRTAAAKRFVWLLQPGEKTSVHIHNVVTQESRPVTKTQDLKE